MLVPTGCEIMALRCCLPQKAENEPSGSFQTLRKQSGKAQIVSLLRDLSLHIIEHRGRKENVSKGAAFIPVNGQMTA